MIYYGSINFEIDTEDEDVAKQIATNALAGVKSLPEVAFAELDESRLESEDGKYVY